MPSKEPQWISSSSEVSPKVTESLEVPVGGPEQESGRGLWAGATKVLGKAHPALASSAREKTSCRGFSAVIAVFASHSGQGLFLWPQVQLRVG